MQVVSAVVVAVVLRRFGRHNSSFAGTTGVGVLEVVGSSVVPPCSLLDPWWVFSVESRLPSFFS